MSKLSDVELNFEIDMSTDKIMEIMNRVEHAKQTAMSGQILRIKINHNTCLVFKEVGHMTKAHSLLATEAADRKDKEDVSVQ